MVFKETFLIATRNEREVIKTVYWSSLSDIVFRFNNIYIYIFTAIWLLPGGSGYFTCIQNMKLVTARFKSGGLHEKHVVATWNVGNRLSICL